MPENAPNDHGPAKTQLTPEQLARLSPPPAPGAAVPTLVPADQVKPEDVGTLSIEYRDGCPVIVVSGGQFVPAELRAVNASGTSVVTYALRSPKPGDAGFIRSPVVTNWGSWEVWSNATNPDGTPWVARVQGDEDDPE
ncbi:hypothetical protein [Streptomyces sp. NPDC002221]|uniref:hypothetical protein n=1 Tax=Streptomyces sp. NPDC002221 TaxID=3364639 RepID=UPI003696C7AE